MSATFNPEMLILAREACGLTQTGLAERAGVSQSKISKIEDSLISPSDEDVKEFSKALAQPVEFFFLAGKATTSPVSFYRKMTSLPLGTFKQCNAQMNIRRLQLQRNMAAHRSSHVALPYLPAQESGSPSNSAKELRKLWKLPAGPVANVTKVVEAAGCIVVHFDFGTKKLDGLCLWTDGDIPFVFLNRQFPADRMRFTLAHELGHLIMHRAPHETVEEEAWEFAAEFLMPAAQISRELYPLNLERLTELKVKWRVSMQGILKRAEGLKKVSPRYARYLWMQMGKCGYRIQEPFDDSLDREEPTTVKGLEARE